MMEGDNKPLDEFRREMQEAIQRLWAIVNEHSARIRGFSDTLENMSNRDQPLR